MAERLQKVLAGAGLASRRDAEAWIRAGRVTVNGKPATLGQRVEEHDAIAIDGRKLRLERAAPEDLVLIYHRPPGEALQSAGRAADELTATTYERLPKVRGRRWLPLAPLGPTDGGLEVFTTDGALRAAASRAAHELTSSYAVRVNGEPTAELIEGLQALAAAAQRPFEIVSVATLGGEGRNRWFEFTVRDGRGRDLRTLLMNAGLEVSRIMRTRFGPVTMDRAISRGRHRELDPKERAALYAALTLARPRARKLTADIRSAGPSRPRHRAPAGRGRSR